jgi:hypothetical protein
VAVNVERPHLESATNDQDRSEEAARVRESTATDRRPSAKYGIAREVAARGLEGRGLIQNYESVEV